MRVRRGEAKHILAFSAADSKGDDGRLRLKTTCRVEDRALFIVDTTTGTAKTRRKRRRRRSETYELLYADDHLTLRESYGSNETLSSTSTQGSSTPSSPHGPNA